MRATLQFVSEKFAEFNRQMFGGKLPDILITISRACRTPGQFVYQWRSYAMGCITLCHLRISISGVLDFPERDWEDIIIHEMIHYYIFWSKQKDTSPHGKLFRRIMNGINSKYGRHVTISVKGDITQSVCAASRARYHALAVIDFSDGTTGVKVLPRIKERVIHYYNNVSLCKGVTSVRLYMTNNPYFNRYPNSSTLTYQRADAAEISGQLQGAIKMECDGKDVYMEGE